MDHFHEVSQLVFFDKFPYLLSSDNLDAVELRSLVPGGASLLQSLEIDDVVIDIGRAQIYEWRDLEGLMAVKEDNQAGQSVLAGSWHFIKWVINLITDQKPNIDLPDQHRSEVDGYCYFLLRPNLLSDWHAFDAKHHRVAADQEQIFDCLGLGKVADLQNAVIGLAMHNILEIIVHLDRCFHFSRLRKHFILEHFVFQRQLSRHVDTRRRLKWHLALELILQLPLHFFNRDLTLFFRNDFENHLDGAFACYCEVLGLTFVVICCSLQVVQILANKLNLRDAHICCQWVPHQHSQCDRPVLENFSFLFVRDGHSLINVNRVLDPKLRQLVKASRVSWLL
jgi:hypothetical protein